MIDLDIGITDEVRGQILEISLSKNTVSDLYKTILEDISSSEKNGYIFYKNFEFDPKVNDIISKIELTQFNATLLVNGSSGISDNPKIKHISTSQSNELNNYSFLFISSSETNYVVVSVISDDDIQTLNPNTRTTITQSPKILDMLWNKISTQLKIRLSDLKIFNPEKTVPVSEKIVFDVISKLDSSRVVSERRVFELSSLLKFLNSISGKFVESEFLREVGKKLIELTEATVGFIHAEDLDTEEMRPVLFWEGFELLIGEELADLDFPTRNYFDSLVEDKPLLFNLNDDNSPFLEPENLSSKEVTNGILYPLYGPDRLRGSLILLFPESKNVNSANNQYYGEIAAAVSIGFKQLISQQKAHKEAITDGLTKLYNHRFFVNQLTQEMERSRRYQNPLSLLMIDIDNFKNYNDTNGHPAGDTVLENVARLFLKTVRKTDYVTRYGGEEFAIILPETPLINAELVAEKLRRTIEKFPFENEEAQPEGNLTISVGVAEQSKELSSYEDFLIKADEALYKSKESGRNRVTLSGEN